MAYQDKFELDYISLKGERKTVTISRKLGRGGKIDIWGGGQPNRLSYPVVSKKQWVLDKFQPIRGSALEIDIVSQNGESGRGLQAFQILDIFTEDNRLFKVEEKLGGASNWTGYLLTDLSEEPYEQKPYKVSGVSADCLKDLEGYKYVNSLGKAYWGYQTVLEVIINCLNVLEFNILFAVSCELYAENPDLVTPLGIIKVNTGMDKAKNPLQQAYVHTHRFLGKNDEPLSCYEVLEMVLKPFGLICYQAQNRWNIIEVRLLNKPTLIRWVYSHLFDLVGDENIPILTGTESVDLKKTINTDEIRVIANSAKTYTLPSVRQTSSKIEFGETKNLLKAWQFNEDAKYSFLTWPDNILTYWGLGAECDPVIVETGDYLNSKTVQLTGTSEYQEDINVTPHYLISNGIELPDKTQTKLTVWFSTSGQKWCKDANVSIWIDNVATYPADYDTSFITFLSTYRQEASPASEDIAGTWTVFSTGAGAIIPAQLDGKIRSELDTTNEPIKNQVSIILPEKPTTRPTPITGKCYLHIALQRAVYDEQYYIETEALPAFVIYEKIKIEYYVEADLDVQGERYQCEQPFNKFGKILDPKEIKFGAVQGDKFHCQFMTKDTSSLFDVVFKPWVYWQRKGDSLPKRPLGHLLAMQELANYYKPSYVFEGTLYGTGFDYTNTFRLNLRPQTGNLIPVGMDFDRRFDQCNVMLAQLMTDDPFHNYTRWATDGKGNEIKVDSAEFCGVALDTSDDLDIYGVYQNGRTPTGYTLDMWWRDRYVTGPYRFKIIRMLDQTVVIDRMSVTYPYTSYEFELSQIGTYKVLLYNVDDELDFRCFKVRTDIIRISSFVQSCVGTFRNFVITLSSAVVTSQVRITFTALDSNEVFLEFDSLSLASNVFDFTLTTDIPTDYYVIKVMDLATEQYAEIVREISSCITRRNIFDPAKFDSTKFA